MVSKGYILYLPRRLINAGRNFHRTVATVMLIWYLKQVKDFNLKFSIKGKFLLTLIKLLNLLYIILFVTWGGGTDEVLVRLQLIKKIIKNANLMCISFSVKHQDRFGGSWRSLSNISRTISNMYTFNPQLVTKAKV